jgi:hypothetical protein
MRSETGVRMGWIGLAATAALSASAQDAPLAPPAAAVAPADASVKPAGRRRRTREVNRETEGTEALGRFEADNVIKSGYQLNGEPLEVDPD